MPDYLAFFFEQVGRIVLGILLGLLTYLVYLALAAATQGGAHGHMVTPTTTAYVDRVGR